MSIVRRIKPGDVFELETPKGLAYIQYIHTDPMMGELIRALYPLHERRPSSLIQAASGAERFHTFFPLRAALAKQVVLYVENVELPAHLKRPPMMRVPGRINGAAKRVETWWIWDGARSWVVDDLTEEQRQFSIKAVVNDTWLIHHIITDWTPSQYT